MYMCREFVICLLSIERSNRRVVVHLDTTTLLVRAILKGQCPTTLSVWSSEPEPHQPVSPPGYYGTAPTEYNHEQRYPLPQQAQLSRPSLTQSQPVRDQPSRSTSTQLPTTCDPYATPHITASRDNTTHRSAKRR